MAIIEVKRITKKYGDFKAVDNISFAVMKGETFGILGPNGAGKTTTLEMIESLRSITRGKIMVDKFDVSRNPDSVKKIIGVQLQASTYFERLKLSELLNLFASFYHTKINAMKLLTEVGLEQKINSFVDNLSGGQKQRFSIASTLVNDPKIVFLDEPTTGLDPQARRNVWQLVAEIKAKGQTIVLTTHYMEEAEQLCDRIAIMDQGKIIDLDTPKALIRKHGSGSMVSFKTSKVIDEKLLKKIAKVKKVTTSGQRYELSSSNEMATLKDLLKLEKKYQIKDISVRPSTLEDVFLNLTGKQLKG